MSNYELERTRNGRTPKEVLRRLQAFSSPIKSGDESLAVQEAETILHKTKNSFAFRLRGIFTNLPDWNIFKEPSKEELATQPSMQTKNVFFDSNNVKSELSVAFAIVGGAMGATVYKLGELSSTTDLSVLTQTDASFLATTAAFSLLGMGVGLCADIYNAIPDEPKEG